MPSDLSDAYALAEQTEFQQRVMMALIYASQNVMSEDPATVSHTERVQYAKLCLQQPELQGLNLSLGVASQPGITMTPSDSDIQFVVNSLFNAYAGVPT